MYPLKRRILNYAKIHNRLPATLTELPPLEGYDNRTTDVRGNEIRLVIHKTSVTLVSYGKDQKPGGRGDDRDVIGIFEAKTPDGNWADVATDDSAKWTLQPLSDKTFSLE